MVQSGAGQTLEWWKQLEAVDELEPATLTESLAELVLPHVKGVLLRREVETSVDAVVLSLNRRGSADLAERAALARERLGETIDRLSQSTNDEKSLLGAKQVLKVLEGHHGEAAWSVSRTVGVTKVLRIFIRAMRTGHLDTTLTAQLLLAGSDPQTAVSAGQTAGRFAQMPWLVELVHARALREPLEPGFIAAVEKLVYAKLNQLQARFARQVFDGDKEATVLAIRLLEQGGEHAQATALREGDLSSVAVAARLAY